MAHIINEKKQEEHSTKMKPETTLLPATLVSPLVLLRRLEQTQHQSTTHTQPGLSFSSEACCMRSCTTTIETRSANFDRRGAAHDEIRRIIH